MGVKFGMEEGTEKRDEQKRDEQTDKQTDKQKNSTFLAEGPQVPSSGPLLHAKFHPHRCNDRGAGPQSYFYSDLTEM